MYLQSCTSIVNNSLRSILMKKVNSSLAAARARLHNATEERDQFFEANDQIVAHLKTKVRYTFS